MKFYTSVLPYRGRLLVRGVDKDGAQKKYRINYKPSLFVPVGKESKYKTLDGRNVAKVKFDSIPEATKWVNEYKNVTNFEYFGNTRHQYPFIADEFPGKVDWDLSQSNYFQLILSVRVRMVFLVLTKRLNLLSVSQ